MDQETFKMLIKPINNIFDARFVIKELANHITKITHRISFLLTHYIQTAI